MKKLFFIFLIPTLAIGQIKKIDESEKPIVIGEASSNNGQRIKTVQSLLSNVSETFTTNNIIGAQWTKLFVNAMSNSLDGMTGLRLHDDLTP